MITEQPVIFSCGDDQLLGILHKGDQSCDTGVVISVGGPQYRVGSHRQFVVMARQFATAGFPVLRFDYRGMGDSEGRQRSFEEVDEDMRAAIDCLLEQLPHLRNVVLLGLCDAASANLMYAPNDARLAGLIILNPWVRTESGEAKTYLRHYYFQRILQRSFWQKALKGKFNVASSARSFWDSVRNAQSSPASAAYQGFISRMLDGLRDFRGKVLILISGNDLTAQEFMDLCRDDQSWAREMKRPAVSMKEFPGADHTMSAEDDLRLVGDTCVEWLQGIRSSY